MGRRRTVPRSRSRFRNSSRERQELNRARGFDARHRLDAIENLIDQRDSRLGRPHAEEQTHRHGLGGLEAETHATELSNVRSSRPAPTSSTTASATSRDDEQAVGSADGAGRPFRLARGSAARLAARCPLACHAGTRPKTSAVSVDSAERERERREVQAEPVRSGPRSARPARVSRAPRWPVEASASPSSASERRTGPGSRSRVAGRDVRGRPRARSARRTRLAGAKPRASRSPARFAHAIKSTVDHVAVSSRSARRPSSRGSRAAPTRTRPCPCRTVLSSTREAMSPSRPAPRRR